MFIRAAFCLNIFLLLLAITQAPWNNAIVMLPWMYLLTHPQSRNQLKHIISIHPIPSTASILLGAWMLLGCQFHECDSSELEAAFIPVIWMPLATIIHSTFRLNLRWLFAALATALVTICAFILWDFLVEHVDRPNGLSFNVLSGPAILAILCLLGAMNEKEGTSQLKYLHISLAILGLVTCICTQSKTALLAFTGGTIAYIIMRPQSTRRTLIWTAPLIIIWAYALTGKINTIQVDIRKYEQGEYKTSLGERKDAITWGLTHLLDDPIIGKGARGVHLQFNERWIEWNRPRGAITVMRHLHNDYLQLALAYGLPALILHIIIWGAVAISTFKTPLATSLDAARAHPWIAAMVTVFLTGSATDSFTFWNAAWSMMTCCLGIAIPMLANHHTIAKGIPTNKFQP